MASAILKSRQRTESPQDFVPAAIPIGESMLVGRPDDVLKFMEREVYIVFFIPFKNLFTRLFFRETEEPEFRGKADCAIVSGAGSRMGFPDALDTRTGESDLGQVFRSTEVVNERFPRDLAHLAVNPPEQSGGSLVFLYGNFGDQPCFIGYL